MNPRRRKWKGIGGALVTALAGANALAQESIPSLSIQLDPTLSDGQLQVLRQDLEFLQAFPMNGEGIVYFKEIFGGTAGADVLRYVDERINWIVSPALDLDASVGPLAQTVGEEDDGVLLVATNIGTLIWFQSVSESLPGLSLDLGGSTVPVTESRAGVIRIGEDYADLPPLVRVATMVHEARHSDCTGGLSPVDVAFLQLGILPENPACGHVHAECPAGHEYAGIPACDDHPWGAYAVEAGFMAGLDQSCGSCTERERNLALALFGDSASRVLDLEGLLAGKYGAPDMTSTGVRDP